MRIDLLDSDRLKPQRLFQMAVILSLLFHLFLFLIANFWRLPDISKVFVKPPKIFRVTPIKMERPQAARHEVIQNYLKTLKFDNPVAAPQGLTKAQTEPPEDIEAPAAEAPPARTALSQPAKVAVNDAQVFKEKVVVSPRRVSKNLSELEVFEPAKNMPVTDEESDIALPEAFSEKMAAFTPSKVSGLGTGVKDSVKDFFKGLGGTARYGALDRYVELQVSTWRDPKDGLGYFEATLTPGKDAGKLPSMPKELIFLIDASLSINENRIKEFKKGIVYTLNNLNEGDRVNILAFKNDVTPFSTTSIEPNASTVGEAIRFMNQIGPSQTTDIYAAFLENIKSTPQMLPSYIFFMSDGRPTHGVTSSTRIIEQISRQNALKRSFFSFSGGKRVNRYLLDFLSYQNRGWSEYASSGTQIAGKISEFYDKIRDPLLTNLRFQFSQLDENEIYPKHLPDFFRNAQFVIYGTFQDEKPFSLRLLGEIDGQVKEIILAGDLTKAGKGTSEIAKSWAFNKIYYLISRITLEGENPEIRKEIDALSRRFDIQTPYDLKDSD